MDEKHLAWGILGFWVDKYHEHDYDPHNWYPYGYLSVPAHHIHM